MDSRRRHPEETWTAIGGIGVERWWLPCPVVDLAQFLLSGDPRTEEACSGSHAALAGSNQDVLVCTAGPDCSVARVGAPHA